MNIIRSTVSLILLVLALASPAQMTTWRGENFSGKFSQTGLLKEWPEEGPEKILQIDGVGTGWGSAILAGDKIFVIGRKDSLDVLSCFDPDGRMLWQSSAGPSWGKSFPETRSTPTVEDNRVYAMSGRGNLNCFDTRNGERIWTVNVDSMFQAQWHRWGVAESPLIVDDLVISVPAGDRTGMVAFNKMNGELVWKSDAPGGMRSYASPVLFRNDSINQVVGITTRKVFAVDAESGEMVWKYDLSGRIAQVKNKKPGDNIYANSPIIKGNQLYVSQGYDNLSVMLEYTEEGVEEVWIDRTLDCHIHGVVEIDGYIYGSNWYNNRDGRWVCLEWETGEVRYVDEWNGKGATIAADGMMYLYDEKKGHVALAQPNKEKLEIVSSFEVDFGDRQHWAHPFIGEDKLFIRHGESIGIYQLAPPVASLQSE